jgi:hypothetical protein
MKYNFNHNNVDYTFVKKAANGFIFRCDYLDYCWFAAYTADQLLFKHKPRIFHNYRDALNLVR